MWFNMIGVVPVSAVGNVASQHGRLASIWNGIILCKQETETCRWHFTQPITREHCLSTRLTCVASRGLEKTPLHSRSLGDRHEFSFECLCLSNGSGDAEGRESTGKRRALRVFKRQENKNRWQHSILFIHHTGIQQHKINNQPCQLHRGIINNLRERSNSVTPGALYAYRGWHKNDLAQWSVTIVCYIEAWWIPVWDLSMNPDTHLYCLREPSCSHYESRSGSSWGLR